MRRILPNIRNRVSWRPRVVISGDDGGTRVSSITQHGITWTFDKTYRVGQFINGDYWVRPDDAETTVTVTNVDPAPTGSGPTYRNGSMVNPAPGSSQGYDGSVGGYDSGLSETYPLTLNVNESLVSTISITNAAGQQDVAGYTIVTSSHALLQNAAVLTCLSAAPSATDFRPPYCGSTKTLYSGASLDIAGLPDLAKQGSAPTAASVLAYVQKTWLDHKPGWTGRMMHPIFQMPNYGREITGVIGSAALAVVSDYTEAEKRPIAIGLIQIGIDNYAIVANGGSFREGGAHAPGRKFPVLFAGHMLGNDLIDVETDHPGKFNDTGQIFYIAQADVDRTLRNEVSGTVQAATSTTVTLDLAPNYFAKNTFMIGNDIEVDGQRRTISNYDRATNVATVSVAFSPTPTAGVSTYQGIGYESGDIGVAEWSEYHYSFPQYDNPSLDADYRDIASQGYPAQMLAALALGITTEWGHAALFDWVDRYMDAGYAGESLVWKAWHQDMWDAHRGSY